MCENITEKNLEKTISIYENCIYNLESVKDSIDNIVAYATRYKGGCKKYFKDNKSHYVKKLNYFTEVTTENILNLISLEVFTMDDYNDYVIPALKNVIYLSNLIEGYKPDRQLPLKVCIIKGYYGVNKPLVIGIECNKKKKMLFSIFKSLLMTMQSNPESIRDIALRGTSCAINNKELYNKYALAKRTAPNVLTSITNASVSLVKTTVNASNTGGTSLLLDAPETTNSLVKAFSNISTEIRNNRTSLIMDRTDNIVDGAFIAFDIAAVAFNFTDNLKSLLHHNNLAFNELYGLEGLFSICSDVIVVSDSNNN